MTFLIRTFLIFSLLLLSTSNAQEAISITLSNRQTCDLELIFNGGFHPLNRFMDQADYKRVVEEMRLQDGTVWPMPIVLDISEKVKNQIDSNPRVLLKDAEGTVLAYMTVSEIWAPDKQIEARNVYGTVNKEHPGVKYLFNNVGPYYMSGDLYKCAPPKHYDFLSLRKSPDELKALFKQKGYSKVVGFQTRNPMHRAHVELTIRAAQETGAHLLLHPAVGITNPGDVEYFTRVKCYEKLMPYYPDGLATLSLLPIAMRMAGPREALWHAIIRKNYGCTHFIVGRDHAGPGSDSTGQSFYHPYAAQELVAAYAEEIGIELVPFKEMVYVQEDQNYQPVDEVDPSKTVMSVSGTEFRKILHEGSEVPAWFSYPEVIEELRKIYPPRQSQGFTIFMTGLSGAGKSTIANALAIRLREIQDRPVTILDGDNIRKHLSSELGFSKEHRSLNVRRIGYVASEITKNRGAAICALIAPYLEDRAYNRALIEPQGGFIEVYVATPLDLCEKRDVKGLYSLARQGKLKNFTGIDDPYEKPQNPELILDTSLLNVTESVEHIIQYLLNKGFLSTPHTACPPDVYAADLLPSFLTN